MQDLSIQVQENHPDVLDGKAYVPNFVLKSGVRKFGNIVGRVQAPVLIIECLAKETQYLKSYLMFGYETKQLQMGRFVPLGFHVIAGEAAYKGLLQRQNAWLDNMSVVMIKGLAYDALFVPIQYRGSLIALETVMFGEEHYNFQQLEAATMVKTEGKWFLIYDKTRYDE
eukprot:12059637-Ditylum_brightwellii.AAC.1